MRYNQSEYFEGCAVVAIQFHPEQGTILVCDFKGFVGAEMIKRGAVVVVSPRLRKRDGLCTVVPLSTTPPREVAAYHFKLHVTPVLPEPYNADIHWEKANMVYTVSFDRLTLPFSGNDLRESGIYDLRVEDHTYPLYVNNAAKTALPPQINVLATMILIGSLLLIGLSSAWHRWCTRGQVL